MSNMKRKLTRRHWQDPINRRDMKQAFQHFANMPLGVEGLLYMKRILGNKPLSKKPR